MKNLTYNPYSYQRVAKELKVGVISHLDILLGQVKNIVKNKKINDVPDFNEAFEQLTKIEKHDYLNFYDNFTYFNFYSLVNSKDVFKLPISEIGSLFSLALKMQPQLMLFKNDFNEKFEQFNVGQERNIKGVTKFVPLSLEQLSVTATAECLEYWSFKDTKEKDMVFDRMLYSFPETIYYIGKTEEYSKNQDYRKTMNQKSLAFHADSLLLMESDAQNSLIFDDSFLIGVKNIQEQKLKAENSILAKKGIKPSGKTELQIRFERDFNILESVKSQKIQLNDLLREKLSTTLPRVMGLDRKVDNYLLENDMIETTEIETPNIKVDNKKPEYKHETPDIQIMKNNVDLSSVYGNTVTQKTEKPKDNKPTKDNENDIDLS